RGTDQAVRVGPASRAGPGWPRSRPAAGTYQQPRSPMRERPPTLTGNHSPALVFPPVTRIKEGGRMLRPLICLPLCLLFATDRPAALPENRPAPPAVSHDALPDKDPVAFMGRCLERYNARGIQG